MNESAKKGIFEKANLIIFRDKENNKHCIFLNEIDLVFFEKALDKKSQFYDYCASGRAKKSIEYNIISKAEEYLPYCCNIF